MNDKETPLVQGMAAYTRGCKEWDNPFHPSLQSDFYKDWDQGFREARGDFDATTFSEIMEEGE